MAAQEGKRDVVRLLTEAKAHVNVQTEVHTLCHVWYTNLNSHFLSDDRVEIVYMELMLFACMYFCEYKFVTSAATVCCYLYNTSAGHSLGQP